jgi:hypothetical protein
MNDRKRVLIIGQLDKYANGVKARAIQRFLQDRGHEVSLVDTYFLSKTRSAAAVALLAVGAAWSLILNRWRFGRRYLTYYVLVVNYRLRRRILRSLLRLDDFDLLICETSIDAGVLTVPTSARTLLDSPTPWADEMHFEGQLTKRQHTKLRHLEADIFESVDYLSFHWESYARYAIDQYGISGHNLITLNAGCTPAAERAEFDSPPRIVYFGSMRSSAIDPPLLSRLTKMYPHIDVYGGPPPDRALGLNYLGYSAPAVLQRYQIGLVTCTQDELRRNGFSAKHPQYLEYGLPVLVPVWRRHLDHLQGSVTYEEHTFLSVIDALDDEEEWRRRSDEAYAQAQRLSWDETLRPLEEILRAGSPRPV